MQSNASAPPLFTHLVVQRARDIVKINFGAQQVNELLGGGLETKAITEMFGEYRWWQICTVLL